MVSQCALQSERHLNCGGYSKVWKCGKQAIAYCAR